MIKQYDEDLETYEWTPEIGAFMERMNFNAARIGLRNSSFANPYGGQAFGYNESTCRDLLKLGIFAYSNRYVMDVLSTKGTVPIHVYGEHDRDVLIQNDWQQEYDAAYQRVHSGGANPYSIYAAKAGGWSTGEHKVFADMAYCRIGDQNIIVVVSNVSADRSVGRVYRQNAIIEVLDLCERVLHGEIVGETPIRYADYAAAALLPMDMPSAFLKNRELEFLYAWEPDEKFNPASITKVLAACTVTDICKSNQEMYQILDLDICNDSNYWAFPGDIESVEMGMYPMMICSNGSNTLAMARHCGKLILSEKAKHQI